MCATGDATEGVAGASTLTVAALAALIEGVESPSTPLLAGLSGQEEAEAWPAPRSHLRSGATTLRGWV
jgi:hypothetical protein